jgi:hypothetical protein
MKFSWSWHFGSFLMQFKIVFGGGIFAAFCVSSKRRWSWHFRIILYIMNDILDGI